jgi:NADH dehydrogenase (ubiquinone) Fe-S protein 1
MEEISPALRRYDIVEPTSQELQTLSKVQLVDQNKGAKASGATFQKVVENFYLTDSISRSSPTMARCSAAKAAGNPKTNFMAPGYPDAQVNYGPSELAGASA